MIKTRLILHTTCTRTMIIYCLISGMQKELISDNEGEDEQSIQCHVRDMAKEWGKRNPDKNLVADRMRRTFSARRALVLNGTKLHELLAAYPFVQTTAQVCLIFASLCCILWCCSCCIMYNPQVSHLTAGKPANLRSLLNKYTPAPALRSASDSCLGYSTYC